MLRYDSGHLQSLYLKQMLISFQETKTEEQKEFESQKIVYCYVIDQNVELQFFYAIKWKQQLQVYLRELIQEFYLSWTRF